MKRLFFLLFVTPTLVLANGYGIATLVKGSVQVVSLDGKNKILKRGDKVYESDTIVTVSKSVVRIVMIDTNIIDVYPNSKVLIKQYVYSPEEDNKNVVLEVSSGQIKSTVKQKYDNEKNKYNVKTPAIVAGVRGTIFTTQHELQTGTSRVYTHEGNVMVGKLDAQENVREFFSVKANQKIQIDSKIERPQVVEVLREEVQKQKNVDQEDGFVKPDTISKESGMDSSRPIDIESPSGKKHISDDKKSSGSGTESRRGDANKKDPEIKEGGKSEQKSPSSDQSSGRQGSEPSKREDSSPARRDEAEPSKREDAPIRRDEVEPPKREEQPIRRDEVDSSKRPDLGDSKKEIENNIKKRLQEEMNRFKRDNSRRSRKER